MEVGIAVSDRDLAIIWVSQKMIQSWVANQFDEARRLEFLLTRIETMSDKEFEG